MAGGKLRIRLIYPLLLTVVLAVTLALSLVNVGGTPILGRSEASIGDFLVRKRNDLGPQPISNDITLVGIDDKTTKQLGLFGKGTWVTRKPFMLQLPYFERAYKPSVVAYDIMFKSVTHDQYDATLIDDPERLKKISGAMLELAAGKGEIRDDTILNGMVDLAFRLGNISLANAMAATLSDGEQTRLVLGYHFLSDRLDPWSEKAILGDDPDDLDEDYGLLVPYLRDVRIPEKHVRNVPDDYDYYKYETDLPDELFLDYGALAYIDVPRDDDGLIRRIQLIRGIEYHFTDPVSDERVMRRIFLPSYALLSCLYHLGIDPGADDLPPGPPPIEVVFGESITLRPAESDPIVVPIDEHGRFFLDFVGQINDFNAISFVDVLDKPLDELVAEGGKLSTPLYEILNNKLVMIGITATGTTDIGPCPINSNTPFVHMHMTAASNILTQTFIRPLTPKQGALAIILLWVLLMPCSAFLRPVWFSIVAGIVALGYFGTVYGMVHAHKFIMPVLPPAVFMLSSYFTVLLYNYLSEQREKKKIRGMFSTMVSGDVLNYLEENPESFSLAGQKMKATVFFSDISGFTTIAETLGAEKLVELLNAYLSPMTDIIMDSGGYVDKYIGDAIMAEWGVPYALPDHATRACHAALDQQKLIAELAPRFKEEFGVDVLARMGLNSGMVSAGNMGAETRFSYTVMGDTVNQAARYEPANKDYETLIMIGESTYDLAKDDIEARLLDKVIVKGKTVPIQVYELVAKKGEITDDQRKVLDLYDDGMNLHWERKWDEAIARFNEAIAIIPDDGPSIAMIKRVEIYKAEPPPDNWQGEFVRKTK